MPVTPTTRACLRSNAIPSIRSTRGRRAAGALREVLVDALPAFVGGGVADLAQLEGDAVGVAEVRPAPARQHSFVDDVDVAEEAHAASLELALARVDVVHEQRDVMR